MNNVAIIETDAVIATLNRASAALAEAKTIQQTKRIVDAAAAAEIYARRQKLGAEASDLALSIKVEALRKLGEMLATSPKATGELLRGSISAPREESAPTLSELGLTKKESAVAQKLAAMPEEEFQQVRDGHVTVAKAIAAVDAARKRDAAPIDGQPLDPLPEPKLGLQPLPGASATEANVVRDAMQQLAHDFQVAIKDNTLMGEIFDADDRLKAAFAKVKQLQLENDGLRERMGGLMNEKNEAIRLVKSLRRQVKALEGK